MTLKEHIDDIRNQLKQGAFANASEAEVSFGIVQRLLEPLGWPKYTPQVIIPEYGVEGQRVDYALCHPASEPRAFIEVKRVGKIDEGIEQLFEYVFKYAFHKGVPIVILTDGQEWRFFYPAGVGAYEDRKVEELDLIEGDSTESAERFNRYLSYQSVKSGKAAEAIEADYKEIVKQREIQERLPEVWSELLQDKDDFSELLLEVVADKTESLCGAKPTQEQVLTFLKSLEEKSEVKPTQKPQTPLRPTRLRVTMHDRDGEVIDPPINHPTAKQTFAEVIEKLGLEEVMRVHPQTVSTEPFYPDRKNSQNLNVQRGTFYINVENKTKQKKRILEKIASELGVRLGIEIIDK